MAFKFIKNRKGLLARDSVILLIVFSAICGIAGLAVTDLSSSGEGYDSPNVSSSTFDSTYNQLQNTTVGINQAGNETRKGFGRIVGDVNGFFSATTTVFDMVFGSFSTVNFVFANMAIDFNIPPQIANIIFPALLAIITTIITFVIISSLTRTKV